MTQQVAALAAFALTLAVAAPAAADRSAPAPERKVEKPAPAPDRKGVVWTEHTEI